MKIRIGYISNSSSSNFIIPGTDIIGVATKMTNIVIKDWTEKRNNSPQWVKKNKARKKKWNARLQQLSLKPSVGITFPSTNYDTWMIVNEGEIYIETSHNHDWKFPNNVLQITEGFFKNQDLIKNSFYYDLDLKMEHSYIKYLDNWNKSCVYCGRCVYKYYTDKTGKIICGFCGQKETLFL